MHEIKDLTPGMVLEGVVTNLVAFGAFVDVGVHQDGLVHVSQLADRYVSDPNQIVRVGQRVRVTVLSIDLARQRIALSMKTKTQDAMAAGDARPAAAPRATPSAARAGTRGGGTSAAPTSPAFVPKAGAVAPNGMRFR